MWCNVVNSLCGVSLVRLFVRLCVVVYCYVFDRLFRVDHCLTVVHRVERLFNPVKPTIRASLSFINIYICVDYVFNLLFLFFFFFWNELVQG